MPERLERDTFFLLPQVAQSSSVPELECSVGRLADALGGADIAETGPLNGPVCVRSPRGTGYRLIADPNGELKLPVIVLRGVPPAG